MSISPLASRCDCGNIATRRVRLSTTSPGTFGVRYVQRDVCEQCYDQLDHPQIIAYLCEKCGEKTRYGERLCQSCQGLQQMAASQADRDDLLAPWRRFLESKSDE